MAYTLGNKNAKNCCKRTILVQLIIEDVVTCFFLKHSGKAMLCDHLLLACHSERWLAMTANCSWLSAASWESSSYLMYAECVHMCFICEM